MRLRRGSPDSCGTSSSEDFGKTDPAWAHASTNVCPPLVKRSLTLVTLCRQGQAVFTLVMCCHVFDNGVKNLALNPAQTTTTRHPMCKPLHCWISIGHPVSVMDVLRVKQKASCEEHLSIETNCSFQFVVRWLRRVTANVNLNPVAVRTTVEDPCHTRKIFACLISCGTLYWLPGMSARVHRDPVAADGGRHGAGRSPQVRGAKPSPSVVLYEPSAYFPTGNKGKYLLHICSDLHCGVRMCVSARENVDVTI